MRALLPVPLALVLLAAAACRPAARELPEPPSIVAAVPSAPEPADPGAPGTWEALPGLDPAARAFAVDAPAPRAGLLLVHAQWGLSAEMRRLAREFAQAGLTVVAPDVYEGVEARTWLGGPALLAGVGDGRAQALLGAGLTALRARPGLAGKPAIVLGIGAGGRWAAHFAAGGAAIEGLALDTAPVFGDPRIPGATRSAVLFLAGSHGRSFTENRAGIEQAWTRAGVPLTWEEVPGAGNVLLDPRALGFSPSGYETARDAVVRFATAPARADVTASRAAR